MSYLVGCTCEILKSEKNPVIKTTYATRAGTIYRGMYAVKEEGQSYIGASPLLVSPVLIKERVVREPQPTLAASGSGYEVYFQGRGIKVAGVPMLYFEGGGYRVLLENWPSKAPAPAELPKFISDVIDSQVAKSE